HVPLLDKAGHLRIDRRALVTLDEARLADGADDFPKLGIDDVKGRRLRDARRRLLGFAAARRREDDQKPGPQPDIRPKSCWHCSSPFCGVDLAALDPPYEVFIAVVVSPSAALSSRLSSWLSPLSCV